MRIWHYGTDFPYQSRKWVLSIPILIVSLLAIKPATAADNGHFEKLLSQSETIPVLLQEKKLERSRIPNPHWQKDACPACHTGEAVGNSDLKAALDQTCYFCHRESDHVNIHPVNLSPGDDVLKRMPSDYRNRMSPQNRFNCITCHDIVMQCTRKSSIMKIRNRPFLRGGYFKTRTDVCYQCHDKDAYTRLYAHDQVTDDGKVNTDRCLICHQSVPQQDAQGNSSKTALIRDRDLAELCLNCHSWQPHPGGNMMIFSGGSKPPNHLVKPKPEYARQLARMTVKNNLEMPLEPGSGKIYCATCHNPHERGVIKNASLASGADQEHRLRSQRICTNCHDK